MRGPEPSGGVRPPRQSRSRETLDRILAAAERLLDGRDYEEITVAEICEVADVSASSFYSRFENKDALLRCLHDRHRETRLRMFARVHAEIDWDALSPRQVARTALGLYVADRRAREPYLRSLMLAELRDPAIAEERARLDEQAVQLFREHFFGRLGRNDPELARRIELGIRTVCAAAMDAVAPPQAFARRMGLDDEALADELTAVFCRYVGLPED